MNVLFHTATAIATTVLVTNTDRHVLNLLDKNILVSCFFALIIGIIFHSFLDYIPHRYPIPSKTDVVISLLLMIILTLAGDRKYRPIIIVSFLGNILPDLIDLSPNILNKYLHLHIPLFPKIFPWHWSQFSGSIYEGNSGLSNLNHLFIIIFVLVVCGVRFKDFKRIFVPFKAS